MGPPTPTPKKTSDASLKFSKKSRHLVRMSGALGSLLNWASMLPYYLPQVPFNESRNESDGSQQCSICMGPSPKGRVHGQPLKSPLPALPFVFLWRKLQRYMQRIYSVDTPRATCKWQRCRSACSCARGCQLILYIAHRPPPLPSRPL